MYLFSDLIFGLQHSSIICIFQQYYSVTEKREMLYLWLFIYSLFLYRSLCSNLFRLFVIKCYIKFIVIINVKFNDMLVKLKKMYVSNRGSKHGDMNGVWLQPCGTVGVPAPVMPVLTFVQHGVGGLVPRHGLLAEVLVGLGQTLHLAEARVERHGRVGGVLGHVEVGRPPQLLLDHQRLLQQLRPDKRKAPVHRGSEGRRGGPQHRDTDGLGAVMCRL